VDEQPPVVSEKDKAKKEPTEKPAEEPTKEPVKEPVEEPAKEPTKELVNVTDLRATKDLEINVEGDSEKVPATLTKSDQGYAFYLMEGFEFALEEPGRDRE